MHKTKNQLDELWEHTAPIDTWIIEKIVIGTNSWNQKIQLLSRLKKIHEEPDKCDTIQYEIIFGDRHVQRIGEDHKPFFEIYYYADRFVLSLCETQKDKEGRITFDYQEPTVFNKLEQAIMNAYGIYMMTNDIDSMMENLGKVRGHIWDFSEEILPKSQGVINELIEILGETDKKVRETCRKFIANTTPEKDCDEDNIPF